MASPSWQVTKSESSLRMTLYAETFLGFLEHHKPTPI